jgi:hypothetical protein
VGYISTDTTVNAGAVVTIGVRTQTRKNDETLTSLSELVRYDGTGDSIIQTITIPTSSSQTYDKDFTINTRKVPGYETYSFKIQDQAHENAVISLSIVTR